MSLPPVYGHEALRSRLSAAIAAGRLPQALLLEGPRGVGKQRLALWIGQTLLCQRESGRGEPCNGCQACRLTSALSHPDLHWFFPVEVAKKGGDAEKAVDVVEEALAEQLARRRAQPLYEPPTGLASHGIAAVRLLLRRLALTPAMGGRKVFVVGDAERLVPQVGSEQAANALLKALEEPPHDTQFVLTAATPDALLPTIRSRVIRVRAQRIADSVVTLFAQRELPQELQGTAVARMVAAAEGCPGKLLALKAGDPGGAQTDGEAVLRAARGTPAAGYAFALGQRPFEARGGFAAMLDGLLERLRAEVRSGGDTGAVVRAIAQVLDAREMAQGNVNPQLLAAVLTEDVRTG
jgi:DNA polymerase-3 subunit delta'